MEVSASILLERILHDALDQLSTDVHLQVTDGNLHVQFRSSGQLVPFLSLPGHGESLIRRVKALSRMDVSESRIPQDGSFRYESETRVCDVRVASVPTVSGESVVMRLLPLTPPDISFETLGMSAVQSLCVKRMLRQPYGLILTVGPTGAGKTTTMYAMMTQLARWGRRVLSIEDPVESRLPDCQQMEVRERFGVTFDSGLKALLRQDPDVLMIGEVRDATTAHVALRAAISGHLVLTTAHAFDMVGAISRFVEFGIERTVLTDVLKGVIVQHLESKPCTACGGVGCDGCKGSGFERDLAPVFAVHEIDDNLSGLLASSAPIGQIRSQVSAVTLP